MRGTWQTTDGGGAAELLPVLVPLAAIGAVVWLVMTFMWLIAAVMGVTVVAAVAVLVWLARHGGEVATVQRAALPPPEAKPIAGRPVQALPAPREFHLHLHGPLTPQQLAQVAAIQQAGYRAYDTSRREP